MPYLLDIDTGRVLTEKVSSFRDDKASFGASDDIATKDLATWEIPHSISTPQDLEAIKFIVRSIRFIFANISTNITSLAYNILKILIIYILYKYMLI